MSSVRRQKGKKKDAGYYLCKWTKVGCRNTILSRKGTIISDAIDKERTCLLGGGAGRSPIDRVIGGLRKRKGLLYLLTIAFGKWIVKELNHSAN